MEHLVKKSQSVDTMLNDRELTRDRSIIFSENVEIVPTFRKTEYNRKPNLDVTFKKLTPSLKMQIREELNTFKRSEMAVAPESMGNTCFH